MSRIIKFGLALFCAPLVPLAFGQTATYTTSNQTVTLTGLGGSGGVGQTRVSWGNCVDSGGNTKCTVSAPYTGVGGGGTISMVLEYSGGATSPFLTNSISPGSDFVTFALDPGASGSITVSLAESTGAVVQFLSNNFTFFFDPTAACSGTSVASCSVGQVGLTPGAVIKGTVHGAFDATPVIRTSQGVISASGYGGFAALAPGTWMEIYGTNLANVSSQTWGTADFNGNQAPIALAGTTVTIGGKSAFIDYVSPTQINAQVPSNVSTGPQSVVVSTPAGTSVGYSIPVNVTQPGLLAPASFKIQSGQYIAALFPDGTTFVLPPGTISGVNSRRAKPGDTIVLYGVGFGTVTPDSPAGQIVTLANHLNGNFQASFGGVPATISFAGLTGGYLGLYQFNVVVPNVAPGDGVPLTFTLDSATGAQTLYVAIGN